MQKQIIVKISPEYLKMIPRLSDEDYQRLKQSIKKHGQQIQIIVNQNGIILDGHTRFQICKELKIIPRIKIKEFKTKYTEQKFVIITNISRRHLTRFQKVELSWPLYMIEKERALFREQGQGNRSQDKNTGRWIKSPHRPKKEGNAIVLFAKQIGIGKTQISKIEYLKKHCDEETLMKLRTGEISTNKQYFLMRGLALIPKTSKAPEKPIKFCSECNTETTSSKKTKCHVHKWFCCTHCRWGI